MAPKKNDVQEEAAGAPEWMVTFSDCMTLLLTFFVLLLSFSSFDNKDIHTRRDAFSEAFSSVDTRPKKMDEAFTNRDVVYHLRLKTEGAEKPSSNPKNDQSTEELDPIDFKDNKVFVFDSDSFFYGEGVVLSKNGKARLRDIFATMGIVSNRILICEYSFRQDSLGPERSSAIYDYLTHCGIEKKRLCISVSGLYPKQNLVNNGRIVEIAFLNQEIFN